MQRCSQYSPYQVACGQHWRHLQLGAKIIKNANPSLDHLGRDFDFGSGRAGLSRVNG